MIFFIMRGGRGWKWNEKCEQMVWERLHAWAIWLSEYKYFTILTLACRTVHIMNFWWKFLTHFLLFLSLFAVLWDVIWIKCGNAQTGEFYAIDDEWRYDRKTLRDVLIRVGIKLNFHFAWRTVFTAWQCLRHSHSKCKPFSACPRPSSVTATLASSCIHWMIADTKKAKCKFSELGIEDRRERKKLKIPFCPNFVFLFIFVEYTAEEEKNLLLAYQLEMDIEKLGIRFIIHRMWEHFSIYFYLEFLSSPLPNRMQ